MTRIGRNIIFTSFLVAYVDVGTTQVLLGLIEHGWGGFFDVVHCAPCSLLFHGSVGEELCALYKVWIHDEAPVGRPILWCRMVP